MVSLHFLSFHFRWHATQNVMPLALRRLDFHIWCLTANAHVWYLTGWWLVFVGPISTYPFSFLQLSSSALFDIVLGQLNLQLPELQNWCSHVTSLGIGNEGSIFSAGKRSVEILPCWWRELRPGQCAPCSGKTSSHSSCFATMRQSAKTVIRMEQKGSGHEMTSPAAPLSLEELYVKSCMC